MKILARTLVLTPLLLLSSLPCAQGEPDVLEAIIAEGTENSQVMQTLIYLSEEIGPRLTGSTNLARANAWTRDELRRYGLKNAHLQKWGEVSVRFDRGPSFARMVEPTELEFEFTTRSWDAGTDGPLTARVLPCPQTMAELEELGGDLAGALVLCPPRQRAGRNETEEEQAAREEREAVDVALEEIGIAGRLTSSSSDLILTSSVRGWRDLTMDTLPDEIDVTIRQSDYEAVKGELEFGAEVVVELDLANQFTEGPFGCYNTVAEIPGSEFPDEVIILSGHLDTWDGPGTEGAQDNGTGSAVMMEAARILMAVGAQPKRTIRICLWTGEEQGLFGSRGYVESLTDDEKAKISACFVDDGGTNYQGGVMCIESMSAMLEEAMAPLHAAFPDQPIENTVRDRMPRGGGSDHASFNGVGIPGFYWKESGIGGAEGTNYTFVHHTQHDTMRYVIPEYLVQSATASAVVAYQLAQADTLVPREIPGQEPVAAPAADPTFKVTPGVFSGEWDVAMVGPDAPDMPFTMQLEMAADGRLRGSMTGMSGTERLKEGSYDGEAQTANFMVVTDFGELNFDTKIEEAALVGTLSVNGMAIPIRGEKKALAETPISGTWKGLITSMDADITLIFEVSESGELTLPFGNV